MSRRALIAGITGQDGSYLAELLIAKGYEVHGIVRRSSTFGTERIEHLFDNNHQFFLHYGDLADGNGLMRLLREIEPQEVYNLAAQSHVRVSFDQPTYTADVTAVGTLRLLEAIRDVQDDTGCQIRFYQASSSEMFGKVVETPRRKRLHFIRVALTASQRCIATGLLSTIARVMTCTHHVAFFSIMKAETWRDLCYSKNHTWSNSY